MFGRVWEWEDEDDTIIILKEKFKYLNHNYREEICSENSITGYQAQVTDGNHHQILVPPSVFFFFFWTSIVEKAKDKSRQAHGIW